MLGVAIQYLVPSWSMQDGFRCTQVASNLLSEYLYGAEDEALMDTAAITAALASLCANSAWHAANSRSMLRSDAASDARKAEEDVRTLRELLPATVVEVVRIMAMCASWHASNSRRLVLSHAARDLLRLREAHATLRGLVGGRLADALRSLATHAAWHAANARSLLWSDSARDAAAYDEVVEALPALLLDACDALQRCESLSDDEVRRMSSFSAAAPPAAAEKAPAATPRLGIFSAVAAAPPVAASPRRTSTSSGTTTTTAATAAPPTVPASSSLRRGGASGGVLGPIIAAWAAVGVGGVGGAEGGMACEPFVNATYATLTIFEPLGSAVAFVASDLRGNADRLAAIVAAKQQQPTPPAEPSRVPTTTTWTTTTLEELCDADVAAAAGGDPSALAMADGTAACALTWLCRFLKLIEVFVAELLRDESSAVGACVLVGYEKSLSPHHPWVTRRLVAAGVSAAPLRPDFVAKLGAESDAATTEQMRRLHEHLAPALRGAIQVLVDRKIEARAY